MHSRDSLVSDLRRLGVAAGDVIMAHASLRAIGPVAGGPDEVHLAIMDAITPAGTLLMYASCPRYYDEVGRGNLTPDALTSRSRREAPNAALPPNPHLSERR
jgi:aminoglycoside N3'-acetyltransferase